MEKLMYVFQLIVENWQRVLIGGVVLTCSIIFVVGVIKKYVVDKFITNQKVRKLVLGLLSLVMALPATALHFLIDGINFDYYWYGCVGTALGTIFMYWVYETTPLRDTIHSVGGKTVGKLWDVIKVALFTKASNKATVAALSAATNEIKEEVLNDLKNHVTKGDDLSNL